MAIRLFWREETDVTVTSPPFIRLYKRTFPPLLMTTPEQMQRDVDRKKAEMKRAQEEATKKKEEMAGKLKQQAQDMDREIREEKRANAQL